MAGSYPASRSYSNAVDSHRLHRDSCEHVALEVSGHSDGSLCGIGRQRSPPTVLEPVMNYGAGSAGSQFFSVLGMRSDAYRVSASDD